MVNGASFKGHAPGMPFHSVKASATLCGHNSRCAANQSARGEDATMTRSHCDAMLGDGGLVVNSQMGKFRFARR